MMIKRILKPKAIWIIILAFAGCYPEGPDLISDLDAVLTDHDSQYDFGANSTFSLPDRIIRISGNRPRDLEREPDFVNQVYADLILDKVSENMEAIGYTRVEPDENPDLILLASITTDRNIYFYYDWWYWNWFYPGWYPGWGWFYPGFGFPMIAEGYRTGSLFLQMTDPEITGNNNIQVVWTAIINGLLEGRAENIQTRLNRAIDQAFAQSPYLHQR